MINLRKISLIELTVVILSLLGMIFIVPNGVVFGFVLVLIYLFVGKHRKLRFESFGFKKPVSWKKVFIYSILIAVVMELSFQTILNPIIENLSNEVIDLTSFDNVKGNLGVFFIMLLVGWVVGGLLEEILFRGFLLTRVSALFNNATIGNWVAIILTSTIFGFSHSYQGISGVITTGLISVLLGIVFVLKKKNLWYTILIHGLINTVGFSILYFDLTETLTTLFF